MEDELLFVYREIAETLDALIPIQWQALQLYAECTDSVANYEFAVLPVNETHVVLSATHTEWQVNETEIHEWNDITEYVVELQTVFTRYNQELFTSVSYSLTSEGELGLEFGYDELTDEMTSFNDRFLQVVTKFNTIS